MLEMEDWLDWLTSKPRHPALGVQMHLSQPLDFNLCVYVYECTVYVCSVCVRVSVGACKQAHTWRPERIRCPALSLATFFF